MLVGVELPEEEVKEEAVLYLAADVPETTEVLE